MIWKVYDKTDTLLETIISVIDYSNEDTIKLFNNKTYNIIYSDKIKGIIYIDRSTDILNSTIIDYLDIKTRKTIHREINPNHIPNINETININTNKIIGTVVDKHIKIYPNDKVICIDVYIKQI